MNKTALWKSHFNYTREGYHVHVVPSSDSQVQNAAFSMAESNGKPLLC